VSEYPKAAELTERVFSLMREKADYSAPTIIGLGLLAGIYIGLGGLFSHLVLSFACDSVNGLLQVLAGAVFSLGLAAVILAGAELFTGNTLMLGTVITDELPLSKACLALTIAYVANLMGSIILVGVALGAEVHQYGDGAIGNALYETGVAKTEKSFMPIFFSGILANFLVCLGVWIAIAGETVIEKLVGLFLPVTAFVALGLEHSIANMSLLTYAYAIAELNPELGKISILAIRNNLLASTLGNIVGGTGLASLYGFIYRDKLS
jgi:formate transporter